MNGRSGTAPARGCMPTPPPSPALRALQRCRAIPTISGVAGWKEEAKEAGNGSTSQLLQAGYRRRRPAPAYRWCYYRRHPGARVDRLWVSWLPRHYSRCRAHRRRPYGVAIGSAQAAAQCPAPVTGSGHPWQFVLGPFAAGRVLALRERARGPCHAVKRSGGISRAWPRAARVASSSATSGVRARRKVRAISVGVTGRPAAPSASRTARA